MIGKKTKQYYCNSYFHIQYIFKNRFYFQDLDVVLGFANFQAKDKIIQLMVMITVNVN